MPLEKPAAVAAGPVESAKRNELTAGREITSTCAGNSAANGNPCLPGRNHPRACGEQLRRLMPPSAYQGSSPRVRGAVCRGLGRAVRVGIIPACAGSRRCRAS